MRTVPRLAPAFLLVALPAMLATVLALSGCDTIGNDVLTLRKEVDFRFDFTTGGGDPGESLVVDSEDVVDFADLLRPEGFTKDEVITVNVQSVELSRVTPAGVTLDVFDRIRFSLRAAGLNVPVIAESDDLPSARDVAMDVLVPGITEVVTQPTFGGRLTVVPATAGTERYVLNVTMEVVVQTEGV